VAELSPSSSLVFPLHATFVALPLEGNPKWQFQALQEILRPFEECLNFQNPASPHLTLMFWPSVLELEYQGITKQSAVVAKRTQQFTLQTTGISTFAHHGRDQVLFLSVAFSPELATLKKSCPWSDGRAFHPHISLARITHPERYAVHRKEILKLLSNCSFPVPVDRLRLYGKVHGIRQTPIAEYVFGEA
jgi:2'-5' RNA ligase